MHVGQGSSRGNTFGTDREFRAAAVVLQRRLTKSRPSVAQEHRPSSVKNAILASITGRFNKLSGGPRDEV